MTSTLPPEQLGRYRIVRRLGAGGMAEVFLAKSTGAEGIEKVLVVKRVLPTFARSPKFIAMFVDEAKVAMRLNHPNIVQVYAFEQVRDEFLLAMEFVDGLDLGRLISAARRAGRRVPPALSAYVVMELAKGLDYAHNRKDESGQAMEIVHRDVSPQNVLLSYEGVVKIADFGIARARMVSEETGVIKGKFSYMSPEQARGQRVDRRSDVYSLGVLLAELAMGRVMYPGQQGMEVLEQVREGRLTLPRQVDPTVPVAIDEIARRATAFDPEERYQSARSFAGALSRWLHSQEELCDAGQLEAFVAEVAPREVTSPDDVGRAAPAGSAVTQPSLAQPAREVRERRNVVVVHGRLDGEAEIITGVDAGHTLGAQGARVLEDIAYKYDAILDWPEGAGRRAFRVLIGIGKVSVDDPLHATRIALDIHDALAGLSADLLVPLEACIGLSRGVVVTIRSRDGRLRYEPVDRVFDVAKDLSSRAEPGEVLATGEVYRLARRAFSFDEGSLAPRGGSQPLRAYRLRGARTREERAADAMAVAGQVGLFGRSMEIQALVETYTEVVRSKKSAFLGLFGELGVGKSALVAAALGSFTPDPRLLRVECVFGSSEVPYAAVAELVREAAGLDEDLSADECRAKLRSVFAKILPGSAGNSAAEALAPLVAPTPGGDDPGDRAATIARAVRQLLGGLASRGPVVVWVDGLQFSDMPSLQLMARLLSHSYDLPLLVVLCSRPDDRVEGVLAGIPRVELDELGDEDRRALIAARLGDASVPDEIHQAIVHRAGGNPFFLIELLDALLDREAIEVLEDESGQRVVRRTGATFALPSTLEDVIAARLAELPDAQRRALRWLSVTGPGLRAADLVALSGEALVPGLNALEERSLVQRRAGGGLFFPSAVVRHVAYESIDGGDRARMHRRVAQFLVGLGPSVPAARLAHHREQAGEREGAAEAYVLAGEAAQAMYSHEEAMRFYGRALNLSPQVSRLAFAAHEGREQILRTLGRRAQQRMELESMRAVAERSRDPRQRAIAFSRLARFDLDAARPTGVDALLRRALDAAIEADDKAAEIEALRLLGQLRRDQGDVNGAIEALDRALSRAGLDPDLLAARGQTLIQKAILLWRSGQLDPSLDASAEAVVICRRLGLQAHEAHALSSLGVALAHRGSVEDAITVMRASIVLDREVGDRLHLGRKVSNVGQLYGELGDVERALPFLRRALEVYQVVDDPSGQSDTLCAMAEIVAEQVGDVAEAEGVLARSRTLAEHTGDPYDMAHCALVASRLRHLDDDLAAAERWAKEATGYARAAGARGYELLGLATRAELVARRGRRDEAHHLAFDVRRQTAGRLDLERAERVHHSVALALALVGETAEAERALTDARAVVEARLAELRDPALRQAYTSSVVVTAIARDLPSPP